MLHFKNKFNFIFLLIFVFSFLFSVSSVSAEWSANFASGKKNWRGITSSADGENVAAVVYDGYIYTSSNGGDTWVARNSMGQKKWWSISSSADGTKLVAGEAGGYLYFSGDSGVTWIPQISAGSQKWISVAVSPDGSSFVAGTQEDYLYKNDISNLTSGGSWTKITSIGKKNWLDISFANDNTVVAGAYLDFLYISYDKGSSWTPLSSAGSKRWNTVVVSSNVNKILAGGANETPMQLSLNSGNTWSQVTAESFWHYSFMSNDGNKMVALAPNSNPEHSDNGGVTWFAHNIKKDWRGLAASADGSKMFATTFSDYIYVFDAPSFPPTLSLSATPTNVPYNIPTSLSWTTTNATGCVATGGWTGNKSAQGSEFSKLLKEETTFTLKCTGTGGTIEESVTVTVNPQAPVVNISASPISVQSGSSTNLTWTSTNASTCTAGGDWSGTKALNSTAPETISNITTNKTFTLTCVNAQGASSTASVSVSVILPIEVTLTATPSSVATGGTTQLVWTTTNNPTACTASGDWSGTKGTTGPNGGGSQLFTITQNRTYTLTCVKGGLTATASVSVNVFNSPVVTLIANPTSIVSGASSELTWTVENANTCTATGGWEGSKNATGGKETISDISDTTTFTLTCNGNGGNASSSTTVSVLASPTVTLTANPASVFSGQSTTLSWTATNATSCVATNGWLGSKPLQGVEVIPNLTQKTIFTLKCTGSGGEKTSFVEVDVVKESLSLRNTRVLQGKTVLSWTAVNLRDCEARTSNPDSGLGWQGVKASVPSPYNGQTTNVSVTAISPDTTEYSLNCFGVVSNAPVSYKLNLHTASPASGGASIPNYKEN